MIKDENYYNQKQIWKDTPDDYQVQVLFDLLSLIPNDVTNILDVGCGDGHITNKLPKNIEVVGIDISEEALKQVKRKTYLAEITQIPFSEESFDLVMANDVIEHLIDSDYEKAIEEMFRVAKKNVILTVPHNEQLKANYTKCADCGNEYHIHWHQRSFTHESFEQMNIPENWRLSEIRYSGSTTLVPYDPTLELRHKLSLYKNWEGAVCPECGSKKQSLLLDPVTKIIDAIRHEDLYQEKPNIGNDRSEIIAFFEKLDMGHIESRKEIRIIDLPTQEDELFEIQFSNPLQRAYPDFTIGSKWPRYLVPDNSEITEDGLKLLGSSEVELRLPVSIVQSRTMNLEVTSCSNSKIELFAVDGLSGELILLLEENLLQEEKKKISSVVSFNWCGDKFGLPVRIIVQGSIIVHNFMLTPHDSSSTQIPFINLEKGHNILSTIKNKTIYSWGLAVQNKGKIPKPSWLFESILAKDDIDLMFLSVNITQKNLEFLQHKLNLLNDMLEEKEEIRTTLQHKLNLLNDMLEEKEEIRTTLEEKFMIEQGEKAKLSEKQNVLAKSLDELDNKLLIVEEELEKKEIQRENAEQAYKEASYYANLWNRSNSRKINKVLVLSHMFPHPDQKISGPFVHEQVKALREYEGIDARVISCRPFWLNGINLKRICNANKKYPEVLESSEWTSYDGVPVLYLPYRVGSPFLPFHLHAFSYKSAVMKMIGKVWGDFKFDLVHAHTGYLDGTAGLAVSEKYQIPFVITEHTGPFTYLMDKPIVKQMTLRAMKRAEKVWCVSDSLKNDVNGYLDNAKNVDVMYNGVNVEDFSFVSQNSSEKNEFVILTVGYLEKPKTPIVLIEAFNIVKQTMPNTRLIIAGDGSLMTEVQTKIKELNLDSSTELLGLQTRDQVAKLMQEKCDVFVLASEAETFGVVLIEALSSGKPVIATKCGGPESIITEASLGELCEVNDPSSLAKSIIHVLSNLQNYDPAQITKYAEEVFSFKKIAKDLSEKYQLI